MLDINRNTVSRIFGLFRRAIFSHQIEEFKNFVGDIEVDESYFGPKWIRGKASKRGRGTHRQQVFGIYERNGRVYIEIIPDCTKRTLRNIITGKVKLESTLYSDGWSGYDGLVDFGYRKHFRIRHKYDEFANRKGVHINGIEAFWSFTKRRLTKFNGTKKNFELYLKECEWRWNKDPNQLFKELINILKSFN